MHHALAADWSQQDLGVVIERNPQTQKKKKKKNQAKPHTANTDCAGVFVV